jgi:transcriptional regulator with XRE-family HTH domain
MYTLVEVPALDAVLAALLAERKGSGLTQAEVASRMGVTQSAVSALEAGPRPPSLARVMSYARALGREVTIDVAVRML